MIAELTAPALRFTKAESDEAHEQWGASCGHHSIAAAFDLTLDAVRKALPHEKGWMSPTDVRLTLHNLGLGSRYRLTQNIISHLKRPKELRPGINRIQFEGRWLDPGIPKRVAYLRTHYVAMRDRFVLDTVVHPSLWIPLDDWRLNADFYYNDHPVTGWHITHHFEIIP